MTNYQVIELNQSLQNLINHCNSKKIANGYLNYGLDKNMSYLHSAAKHIDAKISTELRGIEKLAWDASKVEFEKLSQEEKAKNSDVFGFGLQFLTDEQRERRIVLMDEYNQYMQQEYDLKIFFLDPERLTEVNIEFSFYQILKRFFRPELIIEKTTTEKVKVPPGKTKMKVIK